VENAVPEAHFRAPIPARARIETSRGRVELELLSDEAPSTVIRFVELARRGFYDGLSWHRVVPAFVVQGGDPAGDGFGGPGWSQRCEDNRVSYTRGTVGMALAGRDTGGSQFFITHAAQPHLDGQYTAFARVIEGMEVVEQLQAGDLIRQITIE
jgi:cyclophilin family peptidyl-prolyl cis-trans isomerase